MPSLTSAHPNTDPLTDPERQFLGTVMHLPASVAGRLLSGLDTSDFANPTAELVFILQQTAVGLELAPSPAVLFDAAREHLDRTPRSGAANRLSHLGLWLVDTYRDTPPLGFEHASWLKATVLKHAWRRAVADHAARVLQAVEQCSTDELRRIARDTSDLENTWRRFREASDVEHERPHHPDLGAVA